MTKNQIAYQTLLESRRSNLANETERNRSNIANERETHRSNTAKEYETHRSNTQQERLKSEAQAEQARYNKVKNITDSVSAVGSLARGFGVGKLFI